MSAFRARAKLACRIALIDPDRFNEAVAAGNFPCAPPTRAGAARIFDVEDIVVLRVYALLMEEGVTPSKAGPLACGLRDLLREHPNAERVTQVKLGAGSDMWLLREHVEPDAEVMGGSEIVSLREWRLRFMRQRIEHELREADGIVGED